MEKLVKIAASVAIIIMAMFTIACINVKAASPVVSLESEEEVECGKIQTMSVKLVNEDGIGVIQGKISGDANIEIVNVEAKDSKWIVNYNSKTKQFDGFYADGVKNGEVINIKYKLKEGAKQGKIELANITLTTITYRTIEESLCEKVVYAKTSSGNNEDKPQNNNNEKKPADVAQNNNESYEVVTTTEEVKNKNNNSSNGIIPNLGQSGLILICVVASILFAAISHKKLKNKKK